MHHPDHYALLGVGHDASTEQIGAAFRREVKRWHPLQKGRGHRAAKPAAERRLRALTTAQGVLRHPERRAVYDQERNIETERAEQAVLRDAHGNPDGAAQLAGLLAFILLLATWLRARGELYPIQSFLVLGGIVGLLVAAFYLFTSKPHTVRERVSRLMNPAAPKPESISHQRYVHEKEALFEEYVQEALAHIPPEFREQMPQVVVQVADEPTPEELRRLEVMQGQTLFGLYQGVPLTHQRIGGGGPELITIYRLPIERHCNGHPGCIREQVRRTVLHEVAHHFGIDHDNMPDWVK